MRQHATVGDGGTDQCVELLITADSQLEMAGRDTLDLQILGGVLQSRSVFVTWYRMHGHDEAAA